MPKLSKTVTNEEIKVEEPAENLEIIESAELSKTVTNEETKVEEPAENLEIIEPAEELADDEVEDSYENQETLFDYHEQNPSNWNVGEVDNTLVFSNSNTGRVFYGTVEEFNKLMRASLAQE